MPFIVLSISIFLITLFFIKYKWDDDYIPMFVTGALGTLLSLFWIFAGENFIISKNVDVIQITTTPYETIVYVNNGEIPKRLTFDKLHEIKTIESGEFLIEKIIPINYIGVECTSQTKFKLVPKK